jgi:hypothetical protein
MKKMILCAGLWFFFAGYADAQATKKKSSTRTSVKQPAGTVTTTKVSTGSYAAKAPAANSSGIGTLTITDPTITALNAKANGNPVTISKSGIVGMPKRAYGFANGHLSLTTTGSTTSGTMTGSGAVGTGTSLGTFGSNGPAMGVNGKSPYAGISMWGNARNLYITHGDSSVRRLRD